MRLPAMLIACLLCGSALAADPPPRPAPPRCDTPGFAQFDFWLGEWVVTADGKLAGHNRIEKVQDGCALTEQWRGAGGYTGTSLNAHDRRSGKWRQLWVDYRGGVLLLTGGLQEDGSMSLQSEPDAGGVVQRITWTPNPDGSVRQLWQAVADDGSAENLFDGLYRRAASSD